MNIWFVFINQCVDCTQYYSGLYKIQKKRKFIVLCFNCLFKSYCSYKHWFYFIYAGNKNSVEKTADSALMIDDGNGGCRDFWTS